MCARCADAGSAFEYLVQPHRIRSISIISGFLYPTQQVAEGIMFLTRPSVSQSCFSCQHNSSETAEQNFVKLCSYEGHNSDSIIVSPARFSGGDIQGSLLSSCVAVVGVTKHFCHIFLWNHTGELPDIWHRASVWRTVSCNAVLNLRHVHFLFDATFNIVDICRENFQRGVPRLASRVAHLAAGGPRCPEVFGAKS